MSNECEDVDHVHRFPHSVRCFNDLIVVFALLFRAHVLKEELF